jgi:neutral ceramidase
MVLSMIRGFVLALLIAAIASPTSLAAEKGWRAGVAKVNITPELPIWLSGYGSRTKPAATKHDDLWAKALVLEDAAGHRAVLVTMDLVGIDRGISQEVCRGITETYKLPRSAIALSTSHTHSGPVIRGNLMPMFDLDEDQSRRIVHYKAMLTKKLIGVVGDAISKLRPATLECGIGEVSFAVNRRNNPEGQVDMLRAENKLKGPIDHELPVLTIRGDDHELLAIVAGYACHATVLSDYFISADWPGAAQNEIERRHPGVTALYFPGCGGDQNPLPRRSIAFVKKYGEEFADGVDATLKSSLSPVAPILVTAYEEIDLPFGKLPSRAELDDITSSDVPAEARWAKFMLSEWDREGKLPATYPYPVQAWKLGNDLTWLFLGGEVVVDYSLRLKTELGPGKTWVASYSNDVMGYIPSRRVLGEGGYEGGLARYPYGLPAPWDPHVEEQIVEKAHELAAKVRAAK